MVGNRYAVRQSPELQLQKAVAEYLEAALPEDVVWSSIDHSHQGARHGAQLKARGVKPGLPDILVLARTDFLIDGVNVCHSVVIGIELKAPGGTMSEHQRTMQKRFHAIGATYTVAYSVEAVEQILLAHAIPLRGKVS